ncbi:macrophage mannose receptor 1-like [Colossoma macropomum]|uniref:macrophage mannose receptor 1-like n=1 Tax=Colossoma macropomum TaxID=42526 RepID=UPI0018648A1F|nr:macrophage mannose receptor 1-like [Colossoma macropomum]
MNSALHVILLFSGQWALTLCGTHQFHVVEESKNWTEAQKYCRDKFTDLATIESREEMDTVITIISGREGHFWIGLILTVENNTPSWIWSDGSQTSYRNWNTGQPDVKANYCGELRSEDAYRWTVIECNLLHKFVCYQNIPLILVKQSKTWREALRYCRDNYVDLVSVHTMEIQHWVEFVTKKASTANVWMGLRHTCAQSFWFWVSGSTICYQNWAPGSGTGVEDCSGGERTGAVQFGSKQWVSLPETQELNFICTTV